jgi:hypothetical protein
MQKSYAKELAEAMDQVREELASENRPLTVPPDRDEDDLDCEFWDRVRSRLTREARAYYRA